MLQITKSRCYQRATFWSVLPVVFFVALLILAYILVSIWGVGELGREGEWFVEMVIGEKDKERER